jgi:hypothetical protein
VIRALLFASGLAGVLAAAVAIAPASADGAPNLQFRAVVPGLVADATAPVSADASLVVAEHMTQRYESGLVVSGEVLNGTSQPIASVVVHIRVAKDGQTYDKVTETQLAVINPGGVGPFQTTVTGISSTDGTLTATIDSFAISDLSAPSAKFAISGPYPFQVGPPDPKTGEIPYSTVLEQLHGTVTNTGPLPIGDLEVVLVAYDVDGNVAYVTTGPRPQVPFQEAGDTNPVLQPQYTATFVAGIPIGLLNSLPGHVTWAGYLNGVPR